MSATKERSRVCVNCSNHDGEPNRVRVMNSRVINVAIEPLKSSVPGTPTTGLKGADTSSQKQPTIIPASAIAQGLEASFNSVIQAWHSKAKQEQKTPEDPALAIIRCFGGKTQNSAAVKQIADYNATVSNRWKG
jgi:hypothetical protein